MPRGTIQEAAKHHRVLAVVLVGVILICAVLLGVGDLSKPWVVVLQVASAVAGAALGNTLRTDLSRSVVHNQARPATRHLFDQVSRLRGLVTRAEGYQSALTDNGPSADGSVNSHRVGDWFGSLGADLRAEILATATAIENWGDLAPDIRDAEFASYQTREQRLPNSQEGRQEHEQ